MNYALILYSSFILALSFNYKLSIIYDKFVNFFNNHFKSHTNLDFSLVDSVKKFVLIGYNH